MMMVMDDDDKVCRKYTGAWENKINTTSGLAQKRQKKEREKESKKERHGNLCSWRISMSRVVPGKRRDSPADEAYRGQRIDVVTSSHCDTTRHAEQPGRHVDRERPGICWRPNTVEENGSGEKTKASKQIIAKMPNMYNFYFS